VEGEDAYKREERVNKGESPGGWWRLGVGRQNELSLSDEWASGLAEPGPKGGGGGKAPEGGGLTQL